MLTILCNMFLSIAMADDLDIGYDAVITKGMSPTLYITPSADIKEIKVGIDANGKHYDFVKTGEPAGQELSFTWKADPAATMVNAEIYAVFEDGYVAEAVMPMDISYGAGLTVDYSSVKAGPEHGEHFRTCFPARGNGRDHCVWSGEKVLDQQDHQLLILDLAR